MLHYASGTPANDDFQVVENQLARQRLFSVHPNYAKPVARWLDDLRQGIFSFPDQIARTPSLSGKLARADRRMREELAERGHDPETWVPYEDALRALSERLGPGYPKRIMLDSGAFTDWRGGQRSDVETVIRSYADFLDRSAGLFDEIYLINLDVIPGAPAKEGEKQKEPSDAEIAEAIAQSDINFAKLKAEFDVPVLPVFHQRESWDRLREVVEMGEGYICLSPDNGLPEKQREEWALFHNTAAEAHGVRCHGLATTGNRMIHLAGLYSGDSTAWKTHSGNGRIDVRWDAPRSVDQFASRPLNPFYRPTHVAIERNEFDGKRALPNHKDHLSELACHEQEHVRRRAERYLPFPMVQLDRRAMSIVSLGEIQSVAEDRHELAA